VPEQVEKACNLASNRHSAITFIRTCKLELKPVVGAVFLQGVREHITEYAYAYLAKEYLQAVNYTIKAVEGTHTFIVTRNADATEKTADGDHETVDGVQLQASSYLRSDRVVYVDQCSGFPTSCSCQCMIFMGLLCRHMFQVIIVSQLQDKFTVEVLDLIYDRWLKKNNGADSNLAAALAGLKAKATWRAPNIDTEDMEVDPLDVVPVEKRYSFLQALAKQVAAQGTLSPAKFKTAVHGLEGVLDKLNGFGDDGASGSGGVPASRARKRGAAAHPDVPPGKVLNPQTGPCPGRPSGQTQKEGLINSKKSATLGRKPASAGAPKKSKKPKGSRKGQTRFKSPVEMSQQQKGKGPAIDE
jgi:hypothetical protein